MEFGNETVAAYHPAAAQALSATLSDLPMVFEARPTDYHKPQALTALLRESVTRVLAVYSAACGNS